MEEGPFLMLNTLEGQCQKAFILMSKSSCMTCLLDNGVHEDTEIKCYVNQYLAKDASFCKCQLC